MQARARGARRRHTTAPARSCARARPAQTPATGRAAEPGERACRRTRRHDPVEGGGRGRCLHTRHDGRDCVVRTLVALLLEGLDDLVVQVLKVLRPHQGHGVILEERGVLPVREQDVREARELGVRDAGLERQAPHAVLKELVDEILVGVGVLIDGLVVNRELVGADGEGDALGPGLDEGADRVTKERAKAVGALVVCAVEPDVLQELLKLSKRDAPRLDEGTLGGAEGLLGRRLEHLHQVGGLIRGAHRGSMKPQRPRRCKSHKHKGPERRPPEPLR